MTGTPCLLLHGAGVEVELRYHGASLASGQGYRHLPGQRKGRQLPCQLRVGISALTWWKMRAWLMYPQLLLGDR